MALPRIGAALGAGIVALLLTCAARAGTADDVVESQRDLIRAHGDLPIAAIEVVGLRRTDPAVVHQWMRCEIGTPISRCDLRRFYEALYKLAIFSDIQLAFRVDARGAIVIVRVEEKWTIYPVPILWYSSETQVAGLLVVDANFLGENKGLALAGVASNLGWYTLAAYNDPNIAFTSGWGTLHAFLGHGLIKDEAPDGTILQSFDMTRLDVEGALGWTFWDRFAPSWTSAVRVARVADERVPGAERATDGTVTVQGINLVYADRRYRDLYDEGARVSAEVQHAFPLDRATPAYDDVIFDVAWAFAAPLGGFVDARARTFLGAMPVVFEERLGGFTGSRTLPGSGIVAADRYAWLSLEYQAPFWKSGLGTAAALAFGEVGTYARNAERAVTYGGPGAGLRFYLKHVAVPAFGVDVGYEVGVRAVQFSISIGYRPVR